MGLLLELADRGSLRALLSDNDASLSLSKAAKLAIARDVADAMVYLHSIRPQPILHRNLKASSASAPE